VPLGQHHKNGTALGETLPVVLEHRHLAHLVAGVAELGAPGLAVEEIDETRPPFAAAKVQHQGHLVGVPRLAEAMKDVAAHRALRPL